MRSTAQMAATLGILALISNSIYPQIASAQFNWGQAPAMMDVSQRQLQNEKVIAEAQAQGKLSAQTAAVLRQELARIKEQDNQFKADGKLSFWERMKLTVDLDQFEKNLYAQMQQTATAPATTTPGAPAVDIPAKQKDIAKKISEGFFSNRLTRPEAENLQRELEAVKTKEATFRADGSLSESEMYMLSADLDRLTATLETQLKARVISDPQFTQRYSDTLKRLTDLVSTGKISDMEFNAFRSQLTGIQAREAGIKSTGRQLSSEETLNLALELERLNSALDRYAPAAASATLSTIDAKQLEIERMISEALLSGRMSTYQIAEVKQEFDRISHIEATFRADGLLSENETLALARDLDVLRQKVSGLTTTALPDIHQRKQDFERRLNESLANGRITAHDADAMRADLQRVAQLESTFKGSEGNLNDQEIMALVREFDALAARMDKMVTPLPDIKAKQAAILSKLNECIQSGSLSQETAQDLKREFDRIATVETSFRGNDNNLSEWEIMALSRDLSKLERDLQRFLSTPARVETTVATAGGPFDAQGHWAQPYISTLCNKGTIGGFPDGSFKPDQRITRAQFAAIAVKALNLPPAGRPANFKDVPAKYWGSGAIASVSDAGLVTGFPDGSFRPEDQITRAQALVILAKALQSGSSSTAVMGKYSDGTAVPTWALPSVAKAANAGIVVNHPDPAAIRPNDFATRAEVAALTYQTMSSLGQKLPQIRVGLEASGH